MYPVYEKLGQKETCQTVDLAFPPQHQDRKPGFEYEMYPRPISENPYIERSHKLKGKVAIITGGDSGIGRAVAYIFARAGADIIVAYLNEHIDAEETKKRIESLGQRCLLIPGDLTSKEHAHYVVNQTLEVFGRIDILVNNHATAYAKKSILDIT
jgi:shikimate 5-dehydrogenase